jgi:hypothetical protein
MTVQEIKHSIQAIVSETDDQAVLETYHAILNNLLTMRERMDVAYSTDGDPLTGEACASKMVAASKRVKSGKCIKHEDLIRKIEKL